MRLAGAAFLARFGGRIVNTHPALLPAFPGMHGPRDALAYGVKVTGARCSSSTRASTPARSSPRSPCRSRDDDDEDALHERIKVAERAHARRRRGPDGPRGLDRHRTEGHHPVSDS